MPLTYIYFPLRFLSENSTLYRELINFILRSVRYYLSSKAHCSLTLLLFNTGGLGENEYNFLLSRRLTYFVKTIHQPTASRLLSVYLFLNLTISNNCNFPLLFCCYLF